MSSSAATVARGLGLVVTEVARAGANRVVPGGGSLPLRATDVSPRWLEGALGLRPGAIRGVRIVDEHSGTAARARVAVDAHDDTGLPDHLFVKSTPHSYAQHVLMNLLYRAGITELFLSAVATSETGESMQPQAVSRVGVERAVAGVVAHDSFGVLTALVDGKAV